jgi:hypothetical protein
MSPAQEAWYAVNHNRVLEAQRARRRRKAYGLAPIGRHPANPPIQARKGQNARLKDWLLEHTAYGTRAPASRLEPNI